MVAQFLSLSMFIMLLAFFIVLNTMSNFEDNVSKTVINSIKITFSEEVAPDVDANTVEDIQQAFAEGDVLDRLQELFKSQIVGAKVRKDRLGVTMRIQLPITEFEQQIFQEPDPESNAINLRQTLVTLLNSGEGIQYRMEILINLPQNPSKLSKDQEAYVAGEVERVANYAAVLQAVGLPKTFVTPGLGMGDEGTVTLLFRQYKAFSPVEGGGDV